MTASYSPSLATAVDQVRFKIGDTVVSPESSALFSDEEITAMLMANSDDVGSAAMACTRSLIARFSRLVSSSVGDTSDQYGDLAQHYRDLLSDLKREQATSGNVAAPFAGGISIASKRAYEDDTDRVVPSFSRDGVGSTGPRFTRDRW